MPNLRSLVETGTRFDQAYVQAVVCAPSRSCMASLRDYDACGTATNTANDFDVGIPTYFSALEAAGYHTMSTGKDDLTKATQIGHQLNYSTRNASDTYHAKELGFSDSIRTTPGWWESRVDAADCLAAGRVDAAAPTWIAEDGSRRRGGRDVDS